MMVVVLRRVMGRQWWGLAAQEEERGSFGSVAFFREREEKNDRE